MTLQEFFTQNPEAAVALSGGVDSAYLLYAAAQWAGRVKAYCVAAPFQPQFELDTARTLAHNAGVELQFVTTDILSVSDVAANGSDRCYHCKKALFTAVCQAARADGFPLVLDGTNASDAEDDRPGMRALRELGIRSPLRECQLRKQDIRILAKEAGIPVWDRPSYACLATRIATGQTITRELLVRIELAENALFAMGFSDFRARVSGNAVLLQLPETQHPTALARWPEIERLFDQFDCVTLDPQPRRSI